MHRIVLFLKLMNGLKDDRETTENDKHTGRPVTFTNKNKVAEIQECIREDRRVTVWYIVRYSLGHYMCLISLECAAFRQDWYRAC